jgi:hypothetical protein
MSAAQSYLDSHAARMHADAKTLAEVRVNIDHLRRRIADDQSNLDAAEQFEQVLIKVIAAGQRLLDEEWQEDWKVGRTPGEQHIEHLAHAATDRTRSFPVMQVAKQVTGPNAMPVCDWADCGEDLIGGDVEGWLHAATGRVECHPEPAAPALQEGTDGDPTKRTALPPHIAAEVADHG